MPQKLQRALRALLAVLLGLALVLGATWAAGVIAPPQVASECNPGSCGGGG